jgi:hypothetical protein
MLFGAPVPAKLMNLPVHPIFNSYLLLIKY